MVYSYTKRELEKLDENGYKFIHAEDEKDALRIKNNLREAKNNAQAGKIKNKEGAWVYFVATKERIRR